MDVAAWVDKVGIKVDLVFQSVITQVATYTILATPVGNPSAWKNPPKKGTLANSMGSGMLRANWQLGFNSIPQTTVAIPDRSGLLTLSRVTATSMECKAGGVAWLTNNLPYALPIEYGSGPNLYAPHPNWHGSKQAPAGMLRIAISKIEAEYNAIIAQIAGMP